MTELIETLEKIAELDGGFLTIWQYKKTTLYNFKTKSRGVECDSVDLAKASYQDLIFGAICEKVEDLPKHEIELRDLGPFWKVTIWVIEDDNKDPKYTALSFKNKKGNPATAAAKALLAALEAQIEALWREQKGIEPKTGEMWLTPRMKREADQKQVAFQNKRN